MVVETKVKKQEEAGYGIVLLGVLMDKEDHRKSIIDGMAEGGFGPVKIIGQFKTLAGHGGDGGRNDVVIEIEPKYVSKYAVSGFHLSGEGPWIDDYLDNSGDLIPAEAKKFFGKKKRDIKVETEKTPKTDIVVNLTGKDGNAFMILGTVTKALKRAGHDDLAEQYKKEATAGDYDHLLQTTMNYVEVE